MSAVTGLLLDLFIMYLAAKLAAELFARIHQPPVIGELLIGALIGPFAIGLIGVPGRELIVAFHGEEAAAKQAMRLVYDLLAELGVVVLLFFVGLETRVADILKVGPRVGMVAVFGVIAPFLLGYTFMAPVLGHDRLESIFLATALVATSVGVTARVLRDLGVIASKESRIILGAAVVDDILAMVFLAAVSSLAVTGTVDPLQIGIIVVQTVLFVAFIAFVGTGAMRRFGLGLTKLHLENAPLVISLLTMLGLAVLSATIGLAAIIGAFLAGMVFAEAREHFELERQTLPIYQFLVPFFFVLTGSQVDWRFFLDSSLMTLAIGITLLALAGKIIGCGLAVTGHGLRSMAIVGVGMAPRGEVGLIVASLGLSLGTFGEQIFTVVIVMSVLTTLVAPPILHVLYRNDRETEISEEDRESQAGLLPDL